MIKVCKIISNIDKAIAFEWIAEKLPSQNLQLSFILINSESSNLERFLSSKSMEVYRINFGGLLDYPRAFYQLLTILLKIRPQIIHCHLFHATTLGLLAGYLLRIKKRIYTRHHSSYNYEYNLKGVIIDKMMNKLATDIVAISKNVQNILIEREEVSFGKLHLIHHGFDLDAFSCVDDRRISEAKGKNNPHKKGPVVGVIARWIEWKGIQYIIPAFKKLLTDYPDALLVLANANGPYKTKIQSLLNELPSKSHITIPFERDLFALYKLFDIYVHTPINPTIEAFGQTYVEALAAGIPSVFTLSGVAPEFIEHEKNALVVPFEDSSAIYSSTIKILTDRKLKLQLKSNGKESAGEFALTKMIQKLNTLYLPSGQTHLNNIEAKYFGHGDNESVDSIYVS